MRHRAGQQLPRRLRRVGSITCDGTRTVGCFWSEVLGWPLVWDQDEETAIRAGRDRPFITWGPPLVPKSGKKRLHLEIAPTGHAGQRAELDRLVALAATPLDISHGAVDRAMMAEPDDNEFCVPRPRQRA